MCFKWSIFLAVQIFSFTFLVINLFFFGFQSEFLNLFLIQNSEKRLKAVITFFSFFYRLGIYF